MGFHVTHAVFPPSAFTSVMKSLYPSTAFSSISSPERSSGPHTRPQAVFLDEASLPPFRSRYWRTMLCPHLYWAPASTAASSRHPIPGWTRLAHSFTHSILGGATDGNFSLLLLLPDKLWSGDMTLPLLSPRPLTTIGYSVDQQTVARPLFHPPASDTGASQAIVILQDGSVGSWGLMPMRRLRARITLPYDMSPSGWGSRPLTPRKLSSLRDTPLLTQDEYVKLGFTQHLRELTMATPAKVLSLGADLFFTNFLRGGV